MLKTKKTKTSFNNVVLGISDEKELMVKLDIIPEESKNCFVARWGLDGSKACASYKALDTKLGIVNSRQLYETALEQLAKTRYMVVSDEYGMHCIFKGYSPDKFQLASFYAYLRWAVYHKVFYYDGTLEDLEEESFDDFGRLSERDEKLLKIRFGYFDGKVKFLDEVGKEMYLSKGRVRQIEERACRRLRYMKWSLPLSMLYSFE